MTLPSAHTPEHHDAPDAWHTHTVQEHPQQAHGEVLDGLKVFIIGMVGYLLTAATILLVTIYFVAYANRDQIASEEYPERTLGPAAAIQGPALENRDETLAHQVSNKPPLWTDAEARKVTIPMELAVNKVIDRYSKRPTAK